MATATIAPGRALRPDAAAAYDRARAAGMPAGGINSAWRDPATQVRLFLERYKVQLVGSGPFGDVRWYKGKRYVRHSNAGMVAVPGTSKHEVGVALDLSTTSAAHAWMLKHGARHGWKRTIAAEPWHWEYDPARDQARADLEKKKSAEAKAEKAKADAAKKAAAAKAAADAKAKELAAQKRARQKRARAIEDVKAEQRILVRYGYTGRIDGDPGPKTIAARAAMDKAAK